VRTLPAMRNSGTAAGSTSFDYMAKVRYRSIGR